METFSMLLAICAGNSLVTGEFPAQRPVTRSFDVSFDLRLNKRLCKQSWGWWSETPPRSLWHQCNDMTHYSYEMIMMLNGALWDTHNRHSRAPPWQLWRIISYVQIHTYPCVSSTKVWYFPYMCSVRISLLHRDMGSVFTDLSCICSGIDTPIARLMGPTWGPSGADRIQVGPMLALWTLLSG